MRVSAKLLSEMGITLRADGRYYFGQKPLILPAHYSKGQWTPNSLALALYDAGHAAGWHSVIADLAKTVK